MDGKKIIYDCGETINKGGTEDNCQEIIGVFDRNTDYLELNAISDQELEDELSDKFKQIYGSVLRSRVERGAGDEIEIPADTLEELKSLGYF